MTTIHFVRHGQTDWNAERRIQGSSNTVLTETGRQQARDLRKHWGPRTFDKVYSSDLLRCRETTELLLHGEIEDVELRPALREIHLGPWEGVMLDDAIADYPEQAHNFQREPDKFDLEDAETFYALQKRAHAAVADILNECIGLEVLVVSHGAFIKSLLIDFAQRPLKDLWLPPALPNCAHSTVVWKDGAPRITRFGNLLEW